jgi:hypothetical protein
MWCSRTVATRFFALWLVGCGFHPASDDGSAGQAGDDLAMSGHGSSDMSVGDDLSIGSGGDGGGVGACTTPTVLVLLRNANQSSIGGQVFQMSLASSPPQRCGTTIKNTIVDLPFAVAWIPPDAIAVGADSSIYMIDAVADTYRWNQTTARVRDIFPIQSPQGTAVAAATFDTSYSEIGNVLVLGKANGSQLKNFALNSTPFLLGLGVVGMTQSPLDPSHVFAIKPSDYSAADAPVPFDNQTITKQVYYQNPPPSGVFSSIASVRATGGVVRTAWVDSATDNSDDAAFYVNDTGSGPLLNGPLRCNASVCGSPLRLTDVVPDPTSTTSVIGICEASSTSTVAHVVRFGATGTCEVLVDGSKLPSLVFPVRVALRMN